MMTRRELLRGICGLVLFCLGVTSLLTHGTLIGLGAKYPCTIMGVATLAASLALTIGGGLITLSIWGKPDKEATDE